MWRDTTSEVHLLKLVPRGNQKHNKSIWFVKSNYGDHREYRDGKGFFSLYKFTNGTRGEKRICHLIPETTGYAGSR